VSVVVRSLKRVSTPSIVVVFDVVAKNDTRPHGRGAGVWSGTGTGADCPAAGLPARSQATPVAHVKRAALIGV
jgi:hypothetical protein